MSLKIGGVPKKFDSFFLSLMTILCSYVYVCKGYSYFMFEMYATYVIHYVQFIYVYIICSRNVKIMLLGPKSKQFFLLTVKTTYIFGD